MLVKYSNTSLKNRYITKILYINLTISFYQFLSSIIDL